ncbi:MAG: glycogen synthase [Steroidobacterales bacterium]
MRKLKLCMLTSEMMPFAKTGGLADVAGALALELAQLGHEVRPFMPLYRSVRQGSWRFEPVPAVQSVALAIGTTKYVFSLLTARFEGTGVDAWFVDCPELFDRASLYTTDPDEHLRFLLFTRAVIESCQRLKFAPDIFQCNDWHAALLPLLLRTVYSGQRLFAGTRSVLTIHNIGYQGIMTASAVADLGLGADEALLDPVDLANGIINPLKNGIKLADAVSTVSPTYAREICAAPLGMGMEQVLRERVDGVTGILNGVDYREWDPRVDPKLNVHFGPGDLAGKGANKRQVLAAHKLPFSASRPLISIVSRLTDQKGFDLLFDALPDLLQRRDFNLIVLGSGEVRYEKFFGGLARRFADRVGFRSGYDEALAHLMEAGGDMFLMPSRYEPCGLNQMYSLRYGTIPIVHRTGGLADSVQHFDPASGAGTGCVFNDFDATAIAWALNTTLDWFADPLLWRRLMSNAMAQDFSWSRQIGQYEALFRRVHGAPDNSA